MILYVKEQLKTLKIYKKHHTLGKNLNMVKTFTLE